MVKRRNTRNNRTPGSNARYFKEQSALAAPPLEGNSLVEGHTSTYSIKERVRRIEDSQIEILQLLRAIQPVASDGHGRNPTLPNLSPNRDIRYEDTFSDSSRQANEATITHRKQFKQSNKKRKRTNAEGNAQQIPLKKYDQERSDLPLQSPSHKRKKEYTPLSTRRADILMEIWNEKFVKWPYPLKSNPRDQEKYCHFHRGRGHSTEKCFLLKEEIERLISQGYLKKFTQNQPARERTPQAGGGKRLTINH